MKTWYGILFLLLLPVWLRPVPAHAATPPVKSPFIAWQVWPASGERIAPASVPPADATNASIRVASARGVVASASFAVRSARIFKDLSFEPSALQATGGGTIPVEAIDLRVVKCWYQDSNGWFAMRRGPGPSVLVPELLLHDDSLVRIDSKKRENLVRTSPRGEPPVYHRISAAKGGGVTPSASFVAADDSDALLPLPIGQGETRQFYLTIEVPEKARAGIYHGRVALTANGERFGHFELYLRVIDHLLPPPTSRFSGRGHLDGTKVITGSAPAVVTTEPEPFETVAVLPAETITAWSSAFLAESGIAHCVLPFSALPKIGDYLGKDLPSSLWIAPHGSLSVEPAEAPSPAAAAKVARDALQTGVKDVRIFLPWRPSGPGVVLQTLEAVDNTGARAWVFADDKTYGIAGSLIRSAMQDGYPTTFSRSGPRIRSIGTEDSDAYGKVEYSDTRQVERWHAIGEPCYLCSTLPAGVEDPSVWRRRLGIECFYHGYDGFILPELVEKSDPWNDWASPVHRSRTFLYPTKNGFIPTLAWEGVREAVTDIRYLSSVRRLADAVRYAGMENPRLDVEGRRASMWIDQFPVQKGGLDTMRLDAIAWIIRLDALLGKYGR